MLAGLEPFFGSMFSFSSSLSFSMLPTEEAGLRVGSLSLSLSEEEREELVGEFHPCSPRITVGGGGLGLFPSDLLLSMSFDTIAGAGRRPEADEGKVVWRADGEGVGVVFPLPLVTEAAEVAAAACRLANLFSIAARLGSPPREGDLAIPDEFKEDEWMVLVEEL